MGSPNPPRLGYRGWRIKMAEIARTVRVTVTISSIAEKSFPALVVALIDKRWSVQRGVASGSNSLYIKNAFWEQSYHGDDMSARKAVFEKAMQKAMTEVQAVIDSVAPKALDSYGVRISASTTSV